MTKPTTLKAAILKAIDPKTFDADAQMAHFFAAEGIVITLVYFFMGKGLMIGCIGMLLWATIKEGYWDPRHETKEVAGSGLRDWAFYMIGIAVAVILFVIKRNL